MDRDAKLAEILQSAEFNTACEGLETAEEMQAVLSRFGVELTLDEVYDLCDRVSQRGSGNAELDETDLENVSGGLFWAGLAVGVAVGYACGRISRR